MAPYQVISRNGISCSLRSKTGKDMVVYHNNVKKCILPSGKGTSLCPVQESSDSVAIPGGLLHKGI